MPSLCVYAAGPGGMLTSPTTGGRVHYEGLRSPQPRSNRESLHPPRAETVAGRVVHVPHVIVRSLCARLRQGLDADPG